MALDYSTTLDTLFKDFRRQVARINQFYIINCSADKNRISFALHGEDYRSLNFYSTRISPDNLNQILVELMNNSLEAIIQERIFRFEQVFDGTIKGGWIDYLKEKGFEGSIDVSINLDETGNGILISIEDRGTSGLPSGYEYRPITSWESKGKLSPKPGGFGVKLVAGYMSAIGGSLEYERRDNGTKCTLIFPNNSAQ